MNKRLVTILGLCIMLATFHSVAWAQKSKNAFSDFQKRVEHMEKEANKDPETFVENVKELETYCSKLKDPVLKSVAHALLASSYETMSTSWVYRRSQDITDDFRMKRERHLSCVLDDCEALANAKAKDFYPMVEHGEDADLFDGDMLSVMVAYVAAEADRSGTGKEGHVTPCMAYEKALRFYRLRGNMNAYGLMKKEWIERKRGLAKADGGWTKAQAQDSLHSLLLEVKDMEVGAGVALNYAQNVDDRDEKILFLQWAVDNIAKSRGLPNVQNMLAELLRPTVRLNDPSVTAGLPVDFICKFWNEEKATLTIRKYDGCDYVKAGKNGGSHFKPRMTGDVVTTRELVVEMDSANVARIQKGLPIDGTGNTSITLPAGKYVAVISTPIGQDAATFHVSTMRMVSSYRNDSTSRIFVLDAVTGRPLHGVKVQCRKNLPRQADRTDGWENRGVAFTAMTDEQGGVNVPRNWFARAVAADADNYTGYVSVNGFVYRYRDNSSGLHQTIYTDRSIYRPGQKVLGNLLVYAMDGDKASAVSDCEAYVKIFAEGSQIDSISLKTNRFGTASFSYFIHEDCPVGRLNFYVGYQNGKNAGWISSVAVEEYKRPTFEVTLNGPASASFDQSVDVKGEARMFAGAPVQGATVSYEVSCAELTVWRWWRLNWLHVDDGEVTTDDEGRFAIPLRLTDEFKADGVAAMRFKVKASVTDAAGETHECEWTVDAGQLQCALTCEVEPITDKREVKIRALDSNGKKFSTCGSYTLKVGETVCAEGTFSSDTVLVLPDVLVSGVEYTLFLQAPDTQGKPMEHEAKFCYVDFAMPVTDVASMDKNSKVRKEGRPAEKDLFVAEQDKRTYVEGGYVDMYLSTQETDAYVMLHVFGIDGLVDSCAFVTDGTMKRLRLPYSPKWGESIRVEASYVRNGHAFSDNISYTLAEPDKKLKLEWKTFRNRLQPGQKEQWSLTVTDQKGKRVTDAEMMAVLYDASLDRILPYSWTMSLPFDRRTVRGNGLVENYNCIFPLLSVSSDVRRLKEHWLSFDVFRGFSHDQFRGIRVGRSPDNVLFMEAAAAKQMVQSSDESTDGEAELYGVIGSTDWAQDGSKEVSLRSDFAETAFFLPHLLPNAEGEVDIVFNLPESLTEWKFMGLVHTAAMDYDTITASAYAQKTVMLRPNMPRFLRHGDKASIASSVINQGDADLQTVVRMKLADSATGSVVMEEEKTVEVPAGKTAAVTFDFTVDKSWTDLDCEIVALAGNVGDGERNALPILPAKQVLTETIPFFIEGKEGETASTVVDLSSLYNNNSSTADSRSMAVEYMDSPAWMCVEALHGVANPASDNAISWASALAANASMLSLLGDFPVMEKYENADTLAERVGKAVAKLSSLQREDGGWSWFEGMNANRYISLCVCECLAQLPSLDDEQADMLRRGMEYLDSVELAEYKYIRKRTKSIVLGNDRMRYLGLVSQVDALGLDGYRPAKAVLDMRKWYVGFLGKEVDRLTIYGMARSACILRDNGEDKAADKLVARLRDYTVARPGQGRFYATDAAYYSWMDYRLPTQMAAMRALMQADKSDPYLNDMLLWIVAQKQVQRWDNPMTAVGVARLLLDIDSGANLHAAERPQMMLDGVALDSMRPATMATRRAKYEGREPELHLEGCVLADVPVGISAHAPHSLTVTKTSKGMSWGAVHTSFVEDMTNISQHSSGELTVKRSLYVQRGGKGSWKACDDATVLHVGDKLRVRHTVHADRDMDFVCLKANHPANVEPLSQLSGYRYLGGRGGFLSLHDSCFELFFDEFTRGSSSVDIEYNIVRTGVYAFGAASVECTYAPQFSGHSAGMSIKTE